MGATVTRAPRQINRTYEWIRLRAHALKRKASPLNLRKAFESDPHRAEDMSVRTEHVFFDYSRQLATDKTMDLLFGLADAAGLKAKIEAMFNGEKINVTEGRAVLHTALRQQDNTPVYVDGENVIPQVREVLEKIKTFSNEVLGGERTGVTDRKIKNIVAIGIGGSYLGPQFLSEACAAYAKEGMDLRFVANVDGHDFKTVTKNLDPAETLFVLESKTFTTAETMKNARTAKAWMRERLGDSPEVVKKHFVAASTATEKVKAFGIDTDNMFGFWDWVGGRYSATSAVGMLPLALYIGYDRATEILEGACWMDQHFRHTPFSRNIPVLSALIDIWNINFLGIRTRALLPYSQALDKLPAHTQQVEMESNGKGTDLWGRVVRYFTGEVVFGQAGTNGQHSFYQLIHQGMKVAADFIGVINPQYQVGEKTAEEVDHHQELSSNVLAQPDALAFGKSEVEVINELVSQNKLSPEAIAGLSPHKVFTGNRPSSVMLIEELTPFTAGALLAWTEHRAAVKGFIWGINSFDQWGVELGKQLGVKIRNLFFRSNADSTFRVDAARDDLNPSTETMTNAFISGELPR
ncbi:MAG: glucose-6-phosphate isomerase [Candidatus Margulisbacteria bacterium]|nr:glucose-6-phosphate isomerase [Candidatus Margulisiibacteriota bacterium]MBU1021661.1 glucose-6-phosphate isomerase [Candidatus Margulisiibacteriota bacterium]MBU1728811.1 glucose-6-phosphate isomerase [Candidatus Margulisiibacteriota bacterium]MBU1955777.1 glucose-6-phosphate isomerase [Candidatus Margulisiibacteriota bacterium]